MSIDFHSKNPPDGLVLQLDAAGISARPEYDVGLDSATFSLNRGDLALILFEQGVWDHPLADLISGLVPLEQGSLRVFGQSWSDWGPDRQALARWRIGRVFTGHGWMSNLDIDENVTLSERHHTNRPLEEIAAEADRLARMVGLDGLPQGRPAVVPHEAARCAEWVRAALGSPWLGLLERPGRDLPAGWIARLNPLVQEWRKQGAVIIWMCESTSEWNDKSLNPSLKLRAEENKLLPES